MTGTRCRLTLPLVLLLLLITGNGARRHPNSIVELYKSYTNPSSRKTLSEDMSLLGYNDDQYIRPTSRPTTIPTSQPSIMPSGQPTSEPSFHPVRKQSLT